MEYVQKLAIIVKLGTITEYVLLAISATPSLMEPVVFLPPFLILLLVALTLTTPPVVAFNVYQIGPLPMVSAHPLPISAQPLIFQQVSAFRATVGHLW
jgi:hypothetical protein